MRIWFLFVLIFFSACKKEENRSCLKSNGDIIEKIIPVDNFFRLYTGPYMDFVLVQDTVNFVRLTGGENLLNFIEINQVSEQKKIEIRNKNKCRFLRNKKEVVQVEIHFKQLEEIFFEGSGTMTNVGTMNIPYLEVVLNEGSGTVNLNIIAQQLRIFAEPSWANFYLKGKSTFLDMTVKGNAYADTREFTVDSLFLMKSRSSADVYINADQVGFFKCETWGNGNVYYKGTPAWQEWNNYGKGKLLKFE